MSRRGRGRFAVGIVAVLAMCLLVPMAAMGGSAAKPKPKAKPKPVKLIPIRVGYTPSGFPRLYTAMALNLFKKHGLDAKLTKFTSGAATAAAYASGDIDVGFTGMPGLASGHARTGIQAFALDANDARTIKLLANPSSGIRTVRGLVGKKVGTTIGVNAYVGLVQALAAAGIQSNQTSIVNLDPDAWIPTYKRNAVDALFVFSPASYQLEAEGAVEIADLQDYIPSPIVWVGRSQFLGSAEGVEAAKRFIAALDEGGRVFKKNEKRVVAFMAKTNGFTPQVMKQISSDIELYPFNRQLQAGYKWSLSKPDNGIRRTANRYIDVLVSAGVLPSAPDLTNAFNTKPLERYLSRK